MGILFFLCSLLIFLIPSSARAFSWEEISRITSFERGVISCVMKELADRVIRQRQAQYFALMPRGMVALLSRDETITFYGTSPVELIGCQKQGGLPHVTNTTEKSSDGENTESGAGSSRYLAYEFENRWRFFDNPNNHSVEDFAELHALVERFIAHADPARPESVEGIELFVSNAGKRYLSELTSILPSASPREQMKFWSNFIDHRSPMIAKDIPSPSEKLAAAHTFAELAEKYPDEARKDWVTASFLQEVSPEIYRRVRTILNKK